MEKYVIGIDYGSDSCRALLVDAQDGRELDSEVFYYPRWEKGEYCDPKNFQYRQHPLDYIEGLKATVGALVNRAAKRIIDNVAAISVDTTGSTPCALDRNGVPLAMLPQFAENPNAMFVLWKDHTAVQEAGEITAAAKAAPVDYTKYIGGVYSSEWFFAKMLHVLRGDAAVREAAYTFVEHCDWIPALLTGVKNADDIKRGRCSSGHKGMWNAEWNGLPPNDFLTSVDPLLDGYRARLGDTTYTSDTSAGTITAEWAQTLGLPETVQIGVGAFDCHMGAVGGNIAPHAIVKVMGTSTCDVMIADNEEMKGILVDGICGQVDGSVVPGMLGMEAGQSAYGDVYAWFKRLLSYPLSLIPRDKMSEADVKAVEKSILRTLEVEAEKVDPAESTVLTLDWHNGRRTPYANQKLTGALTGLTLASDAPVIYRSLLEGTAYGARAIVERFRECGVRIDYAIGIGGICKKSPLSMQIVADVLNMPVRVCRSEQVVALGASIFAAVAGGIYPDVSAAQQHMASPFEAEYTPNPDMVKLYNDLYAKYLALGAFVEGQLK